MAGPGESEDLEGPTCARVALKGEGEKPSLASGLLRGTECCFSTELSSAHRSAPAAFAQGQSHCSGSLARHLVSVVGVHEVEGGGR